MGFEPRLFQICSFSTNHSKLGSYFQRTKILLILQFPLKTKPHSFICLFVLRKPWNLLLESDFRLNFRFIIKTADFTTKKNSIDLLHLFWKDFQQSFFWDVKRRKKFGLLVWKYWNFVRPRFESCQKLMPSFLLDFLINIFIHFLILFFYFYLNRSFINWSNFTESPKLSVPNHPD